MTRVKRGTIKTKKRERILRHTKGYRWGRKAKLRAAREALMHAWTYSYRDRRARKRDFRRLWNIKINAAVRGQGLSYSVFINKLKKANVQLDRKVLAGLAEHQPDVFRRIVEKVK